MPDGSADIRPSTLNVELSLTNAKRQECIVMAFPSGTDTGVGVAFQVPQVYVGSPVLVIRGVLDLTPGTNTLAFGAQQLSRADNEAVDTAYETEDVASYTFNSGADGYADEDEYEETITLTPASAYVAGDTIYLFVYRDDSVDDFSAGNFLLTGLFFQYADA